MFRQGLVFSPALPEGRLSWGQCQLHPDALISLQNKTCENFILAGSRLRYPTNQCQAVQEIMFFYRTLAELSQALKGAGTEGLWESWRAALGSLQLTYCKDAHIQ